MASVVSLELTLDPVADAAVRAEWRALAEAGLPSQAHHTGASNRPHLTLLVRSTLGTPDATGLAPLLPVPLTLGAPVLFGAGRHRVIARAVVPSVPLLELHAAVHALSGPGDDVPHTVPGAWVPHVTLARRVPVEGVSDALTVLADAPAEIAATAPAVRRWDSAVKTVTTIVGRDTLEEC